MTALLTDNLPLLASAPNGIKKLRELILELAVRGKLVPQDPNDEPASELLKRISEEKALSGNSKNTKLLAEVIEDEHPFSEPSNWVLSRLGHVGEWAVGSGFPKREQGLTDQPIPFCKVSDMNLSGNERFILAANNSIDEATASRLRVNIHPAGTVVFPKIGGAIATNKRRLLVKPTAIDNNCLGLTPNGILSSNYLYLLLSSIDLTKYQAGTSVPALSQGVLTEIIVGVPPSAEQHRIVAKVDELMALCDRLEAQQTDADSAHTQLVQALLDSLTQASDADDFTQSWQRLAEHFHTLFTTESSIDALKQTLLQLAVMGKLVPQDPSDEPASELLKRIADAKAQEASKGRGRKVKPATDHRASDTEVTVPAGWSLSTVGEVTICRDGERIPVSQAEREGRAKTYDYYGASGVIDKIDGYLFDKPLLLVGEDGANLINRSTPIAFMARGKYWVNNHAHVLDGVSEALLLYVQLYFNAIDLKPYVTGTAQPKMNQAKMNSIVLLLPPEAEQHRIVAKVDQLMALCDQLKTRLTQARQLNEQLASILVEQAVA